MGYSHSLQIPNPTSKMPSGQYPVATFGTSVRAKEFNRLFSTVSNLTGLIAYEKRRINT